MSYQVSKYLPDEWKHANQTHFDRAATERQRSERLTAECRRVIEDAEKTVKRSQQDANKRLEQRLKDIRFWKQELDQKQQDMVQEIDMLVTLKNRVEKALEGCTEPLTATLNCLKEREKRVATDLVSDAVEIELLKEKDVVEGVQAVLKRLLQQIEEQIRLIRSAKYYIQKDLQDKFQAERIDDFCSMLTSTTSSIEELVAKEPCTEGSITKVTQEEWENFCNINIRNAETERNNSVSLRGLVEGLLEQTAEDMQRQHHTTTTVLQQRIQETRAAKIQLESQLDKVLEEIANQEKNIEALKASIAAKEGPLTLAQARLHARSHRPSRELCHDLVHIRLRSEVEELALHIERLKECLAESEIELKSLTRNQLALEEQIQIKAHSLYIDEVICSQVYQPVVIHNY